MSNDQWRKLLIAFGSFLAANIVMWIVYEVVYILRTGHL